MEHYDELGVAPDASTAEIRRSYLALARRFHPDHHGTGSAADRASAGERMARLNAAWEVLSDSQQRRRYDAARRGPASGATVRDLGDTWVAFDQTGEDIDPRLVDDTPSGATPLHWSVTLLPAGLVTGGVVTVALGFLIGLTELLGLGFVLFCLGVVAFLMIPLIALANSSRADRRG